jgi:hypothetical protein
VSAGFDILALIPVAGDISKTVAKVTDFVKRVPRRFNEVTRLVATAKRLPDSVKTRALKALMLGRYGRLTAMGLSDDVVRRLARGQRTDLRVLADASVSELRRNGPVIAWRNSGRLGEPAAREPRHQPVGAVHLGLSPSKRVYTSLSPRRSRVHDGSEIISNNKLRNHEVKTGVTNRSDDLKQCRKDGQIQRGGKGDVVEVVWHFVGNSKYNSMGPSRDLLNCLKQEGLKFVIHPPAA